MAVDDPDDEELGTKDVLVTRGGNVYRITFTDEMGNQDVALLDIDDFADPNDLAHLGLTMESGAVGDVLNINNSADDTDTVAILTDTSLTGLGMGDIGIEETTFNEIQTLRLDATGGTFRLSYTNEDLDTFETANLNFDISAAALQAELETVLATALSLTPEEPIDNIRVVQNDDVYVFYFRGLLSNADVAPIEVVELANNLTRIEELPGGDLTTVVPGDLFTTTRLDGITAAAQNEIQQLLITATGGTFTLAFPDNTDPDDITVELPFDVTRAQLQLALEALPAIVPGDVIISEITGGFNIEFVSELSSQNVPEMIVDNLTDGTVTVNEIQAGLDTGLNNVQVVTVNASQGFFQLQLYVPLVQKTLLTEQLAHDASAEQVRRALQQELARELNGIAEGADLSRTREAFKSDFSVARIDNVYIIGFQGVTRQIDGGEGVSLLNVIGDDEFNDSGSAEVRTRMDGINYYGIEQINLNMGSGTDILNVQGTSPGSFKLDRDNTVHAATNITLAVGNDQIFISSNADLDHANINDGDVFEFLTGHLDDVLGNLNLDVGTGTHRLLISDEAATVGDANITISDIITTPTGGDTFDDTSAAEIQVKGLAYGDITYGADASANFYDGIIYWTGSGDDTIFIDGTHVRDEAVERTTTLLNTGLGDDHVTVDLDVLDEFDEPEDGFFVLHTMGAKVAHTPVDPTLSDGIDDPSDDDTVRASESTLPLIIFGGLGNDDIIAGQNEDIVFGDFGRVQYLNSIGELIAVFGFGARDDVISSQVIDPTWVISRDLNLGGVDIIEGGEDDDILIGGAGGNSIGDYIDGDEGDDLIFGDAVRLERRDTDVTVVGGEPGSITNPRFQTLEGQVIYTRNDIPAFLQGLTPAEFGELNGSNVGEVLVDGVSRDIRHQDGTLVAAWNEYEIVELYHSFDIEAGMVPGLEDSFGDDYIAGGADHDVIFGQLGDDVIQGDGSIESAVGAETLADNRVAAAQAGLNPVGARRVDAGTSILPPELVGLVNQILDITASFETAEDGDDYIEGNGGNDTVFGNLGQDDIIGGSSSLFTLNDSSLRPDGDGADFLFGGSGERIDRNHDITDTNKDTIVLDDVHARDSDVIAGDNANIYRIVGTGDITPPGEATIPGTGDTGGFLDFNYDAVREAQRIIVRAVELLDYTLGGPDFDMASAATDIGAGDEIHGGSGDDFIYGMVGSDVLFGDSEDDDIIGGWGLEWISGGTGDDGVLGDGGRIYTSRNSTIFGESLFGIAALSAVDVEIDTPGNIQEAIINVNGQLKKTVDLTPFNVDPSSLQDALFNPMYADDIIYGGLGGDFLHGGAGDDAISGAEALPISAAVVYPDNDMTDNARTDGVVITLGYDTPFNSGNILGADALRAEEFAAYDEFNPRTKILVNVDGDLLDYFLNFDETEGPVAPGSPSKFTDGDDRIFGDLGNDWLVGGTGRDTSYGGRGNDLMNADDDHNTASGLNDVPDGPEYSYEDRAFGGAGRDVLIANTGGDRLIDWVGEFNSFLVPFAPFGPPTVSRAPQPQMAEFLYDLSESDGADPTRAADTGNAVNRNGEPDGELGVVLQKDDDWGDQTGGPADPQAGNIPGGKRDIRGGADFNSGTASSFFADSGTWTVSGGRFEVAPEILGADAVSVYMVNEYLPNYFELKATINAGKPTAGLKSNAYLIFDYQSETDFKYAGVNISNDKMEMGYRDATGWHELVQTSAKLRPNTDYELLLALNGTAVTLVVDNQDVFNYVYAPRVDADGFSYGLNAGMVGIGALNSVARIDNVKVQVLPPEITFEDTDDFTTAATLLTGATTGDWQVVNNRYQVDATSIELAQSLAGLTVDGSSLIRLEGVLNTDGIAGYVFDRYSATDFKFAAISATDDQAIIGHYARQGWVIDTAANWVINDNQDYDVDVTVKGSTVSVLVNGQTVVSHAFNAVAVDGEFGLLAKDGIASFDTVTFGTDDPAFGGVGEAALLAAQSAGESVATSTLTHGQLEKIFDAAVTRWTGVGYIDQARLATLDDLEFYIADMVGLALGRSSGNRIFIDPNAAGHGWFVDETPDANEEFLLSSNGWVAKPNSAAYGKMDLLTAVSHEIGHYLGLDHDDATSDTSVMSDTLQSGSRYVGEESSYRHMGEDTLLSSAFFAAGSAFLEETLGLTGESEDEEDGSEETLALVFDEESGEFSESEATSDDDEWYIDNGDVEPDEDVYALLDLEDEDFTQLAGLSLNDTNGQSDSRINWNGQFTG